jgi:hypothetical protein
MGNVILFRAAQAAAEAELSAKSTRVMVYFYLVY